MPHLCSPQFCFFFTVSLSVSLSFSGFLHCKPSQASFPACFGGPSPSHRQNTHQPFYPPFLLCSSEIHPIFYIYKFTPSFPFFLSPLPPHFHFLSPSLERLDFCLACLSLFFLFFLINLFLFLCFSEFFLAHLTHPPLLVNYSSGNLSFFDIWVLVGSSYFRSALAYLCLLSLSWLKKKPLLFFSGFSRKKIKEASLDRYKGKCFLL